MAPGHGLRRQSVPGQGPRIQDLTVGTGPIADMRMLLARADYFALDAGGALTILAEVQVAMSGLATAYAEPRNRSAAFGAG